VICVLQNISIGLEKYKHRYRAKKGASIELYLKSNQTWLVAQRIKLFRIDSGTILISLSKHTRKDFQIIIVFGHSAFIKSQSTFVSMNVVLKRYI